MEIYFYYRLLYNENVTRQKNLDQDPVPYVQFPTI